MITTGGRERRLDPLAVCETVAAREVVVEHEHVSPYAAEPARELGGRGRRRDHRHVPLRLDQTAQAGQHSGMVIEQRDTEHVAPSVEAQGATDDGVRAADGCSRGPNSLTGPP
jgi:hypothetical protein